MLSGISYAKPNCSLNIENNIENLALCCSKVLVVAETDAEKEGFSNAPFTASMNLSFPSCSLSKSLLLSLMGSVPAEGEMTP